MKETLRFNLNEVVPFINWLYFFFAWQLPSGLAQTVVRGKKTVLPNVSREQEDEARRLYEDALDVLHSFEGQFQTFARFGLFEANSEGDDIRIYNEENGTDTIFPCLRQQHAAIKENPNLCMSDFIVPRSIGKRDHIGVFATTVSPKMEDSFGNDAYRHLIVQTLCDRLAEATSELAHLKIRTSLWGYAPNEHLSLDDLLQEKFQGIRPAVGYPSLPDQSVNFILDELIDFKSIGIRLTENGAMRPHASVSGLMIAHPASRYFAIGKIGEDQFQNYVQRRGLPSGRLRQFLNSNL